MTSQYNTQYRCFAPTYLHTSLLISVETSACSMLPTRISPLVHFFPLKTAFELLYVCTVWKSPAMFYTIIQFKLSQFFVKPANGQNTIHVEKHVHRWTSIFHVNSWSFPLFQDKYFGLFHCTVSKEQCIDNTHMVMHTPSLITINDSLHCICTMPYINVILINNKNSRKWWTWMCVYL